MPRSTRKSRSIAPAFPAAADLSTPAAVRALPEEQAEALAAALAAARDGGASGDATREQFGAGCTGPVRRDLFRRFGYEQGRIARSYEQYRDGNPRHGTAREEVAGSKAAAAREAADAEAARIAAEAEAAAASKAKRRAAARKAAATRAARKG